MSVKEFTSKIREILGLTEEPFSEIDDNLLFLAFVSKDANLDPEFKDQMIKDYGFCDYEKLEFMGDAVLEIIITIIITSIHKDVKPSDMSDARIALTRNTTLYCFMNKYDLCSEIIPSTRYLTLKTCADTFEAILGAIFLDLYYSQAMLFSSLDYILMWMKRNQTFDQYIRNVIFTKNIDTTCSKDLTLKSIIGRQKDGKYVMIDPKPIKKIYQSRKYIRNPKYIKRIYQPSSTIAIERIKSVLKWNKPVKYQIIEDVLKHHFKGNILTRREKGYVVATLMIDNERIGSTRGSSRNEARKFVIDSYINIVINKFKN
jgi:dsRNA-specific ribonuclease